MQSENQEPNRALSKEERADEKRALNIKCHRAEFGLWNWASNQHGRRASGKAMAIAPWAVKVLNEAARQEVRKMIQEGKDVPHWIAEKLDKMRRS